MRGRAALYRQRLVSFERRQPTLDCGEDRLAYIVN
jgi:hypothetical protein